MLQNPMLSPIVISPCTLMPAATARSHESRPPASPETLIASLVAHLRDKTLDDAQCVLAIKAMLHEALVG